MATTWVECGLEEELTALAAQAPVHTHTQTQMEIGMMMRRTKTVTPIPMAILMALERPFEMTGRREGGGDW